MVKSLIFAVVLGAMVVGDVSAQCGGSLSSEVSVSLSSSRRGVVQRIGERVLNIGQRIRGRVSSKFTGCGGRLSATVSTVNSLGCSGAVQGADCAGDQRVQSVEMQQSVQSPACPTCPQPTSVTSTFAVQLTGNSSYQSAAQSEAQQMASLRFKGHVRGTIGGIRFCGVGWSSSSPNAPTCEPGRGMMLVADATARGADGWYRVRYWQ